MEPRPGVQSRGDRHLDLGHEESEEYSLSDYEEDGMCRPHLLPKVVSRSDVADLLGGGNRHRPRAKRRARVGDPMEAGLGAAGGAEDEQDGFEQGAVGGEEGLRAELEGAVGGARGGAEVSCQCKHSGKCVRAKGKLDEDGENFATSQRTGKIQDRLKDRERLSKSRSVPDFGDGRGRTKSRRNSLLTSNILRDYDKLTSSQRHQREDPVELWLQKAWPSLGTDVDTGKGNAGVDFSDDFDTPVISTVPSDCEADDESDEQSVINQKLDESVLAQREEALSEAGGDVKVASEKATPEASNRNTCAIM